MKPVQVYTIDYEAGDHYRCLLMSDLHWDNPKCDRDRLRRDLDYAVKNDLDIFMNGDIFCAMQGRYDGRRMKSDIREEHNTSTYLDSLVGTAIEWFLPYSQHIQLVGYGNHETSILKNCETDILGGGGSRASTPTVPTSYWVDMGVGWCGPSVRSPGMGWRTR